MNKDPDEIPVADLPYEEINKREEVVEAARSFIEDINNQEIYLGKEASQSLANLIRKLDNLDQILGVISRKITGGTE